MRAAQPGKIQAVILSNAKNPSQCVTGSAGTEFFVLPNTGKASGVQKQHEDSLYYAGTPASRT